MHGDGDSCTGCYVHFLSAAGESVLHAMLFRKLPSEKGKVSSGAARLQNNIHRRMCLHMITTAQNNRTIWNKRFVYADQLNDIPRPSWLRPGFVTKRHIDEVLMEDTDSRQHQEQKTVKVKPNQRQDGGPESLLGGECQDRDEMAKAIIEKSQHTEQKTNEQSKGERTCRLPREGWIPVASRWKPHVHFEGSSELYG